MHDYHEGIGRDLLGSLMAIYAERVDVLEGNTPDVRLNVLGLHLQAWTNTSDLRCPSRTFSMVSIGRPNHRTYPALGSKYKAAHIKIYTGFMADFCQQHCDGTPESKLRGVCAWGAAEFLRTGAPSVLV